jgi:hypothetical protein
LLIKSPAGDFPITIDSFETEGGKLVIVGRMGVWDARTYVESGEFLRVFAKLLFSPSVLWFALKAPLVAMFSKKPASE